MIKKYLKKIFKKIVHGFFFKIYGPITSSIEPNQDKRIKVQSINLDQNLNYKVYKIVNGRLYTDHIQDTAAILENKIIKGPSFQLRKGSGNFISNSKITDNIVFKIGTPRKIKSFNGSVLSLLTGGAGNNNYWHWLFDVLPRLNLCSQFININEIDYYLFPNLVKKFQIQTLDCLNIPKQKRITSKLFRHIKTRELIVTDHPVVTSGNSTKDINNIPNWIILWLRESFLTKNKIINNDKKKRIYIDRNESESKNIPQRILTNENEIKNHLFKNNFVSIKLHETNFNEQVNTFYNADCIVGMHGGGFGNIIFCKPGTKIIELKSFSSGNAIKNLAKKNNLNYECIEVKSKELYKFEFPNQQGAINIPLSTLNKLI